MSQKIDTLEAEIATLFAEIYAVTARALKKLAEFDSLNGWGQLGYQSPAHWMNSRMGISLGTAREHVRVARALEKLPRIAEAFSTGTLSYSKVRAVTRIATEKTEQALLYMALDGTASQMDRIVSATRRYSSDDAKKQAAHRSLQMGYDSDGMFYLRVRLLPDEGARVMQALEAHTPRDSRDVTERRADGLVDALSAENKTEVVVHVDVAEAQGQVETPHGNRISVAAETSRRLSCDSAVRVMTHDADGHVLDVGRKTRRISGAMRRALDERDRGCCFPGCPNKRVDAHHVEHWADGGETKLDNLMSLCRFHHVKLHEGGFSFVSGEFVRPDGSRVHGAGRLPVVSTLPRECVSPWRGADWMLRYADLGLAVEQLISMERRGASPVTDSVTGLP